VHRLLVTVNIPSSSILVTLMMEELSSSEMSFLTRATQRKFQEDGSLHSQKLFPHIIFYIIHQNIITYSAIPTKIKVEF
jgi:hypothetical protein